MWRWMSSFEAENSNRPAWISLRISSSTWATESASGTVISPTEASIRAWAIEPSMSSSASRRSKETLSEKASTRTSVGSRNTPPQAFCGPLDWGTLSLLTGLLGHRKTTSQPGPRKSTRRPSLHSQYDHSRRPAGAGWPARGPVDRLGVASAAAGDGPARGGGDPRAAARDRRSGHGHGQEPRLSRAGGARGDSRSGGARGGRASERSSRG